MPLFVEPTAAPTPWAFEEPRSGREVLAWGIETTTGEVRHIRDLTREQTGRACGIECIGCGEALQAFNAGATHWRHRPHFKHPAGTRREDCHIVAARMAMVHALMHGDVLTLPAHKQPGHWIGLSGFRYEAWRNLPPEQVRVRTINYTDRTRALITLDDGRRLAVMLRGTFSLQGDDVAGELACLTIEAGAAAELLSQLTPEELRQRLTLLPSPLEWRCHWQDATLEQAACDEARELARTGLDEWPENLAPDEPGDRRRETFLHRMVREVLSQSGVVEVPGWRFPLKPGELGPLPHVPSHRLHLSDLRTEKGLAGRIPDIQCTATAEEPSRNLPLLAIEVVVHNAVTAEKLQELRAARAAVLAINLANWGGQLTMEELRSIVVLSIDCKAWLCHPLRDAQAAEIEAERALAQAWRIWRRSEPTPGRRSAARPPADEDDAAAQAALLSYGARYRETATAYLEVSQLVNRTKLTLEDLQERTQKREDLWAHLCWIADELADLGAPGGVDDAALSWLMRRLLCISENRGVGHASNQNARAIINNVLTELKVRQHDAKDGTAKPSPTALLCVLAFQTFEIKLRGKTASGPYNDVRAVVRLSLKSHESRFLWDRTYVPLVRAVFPELADQIDKLSPRMNAIANGRRPEKP